MSWPNPFRQRDQYTRTAWGYTFQITDNHLTPQQTSPMKHSFDRLGDEALKRLDAISHPLVSREVPDQFDSPGLRDCQKTSSSQETVTLVKRDLYISLRDHAQCDPVLGQLWAEAHTVPSWVDWNQIARGQDVFYRYGGPALTGLAFQSLLGGMVSVIGQEEQYAYADNKGGRVRTELWKYLQERSVLFKLFRGVQRMSSPLVSIYKGWFLHKSRPASPIRDYSIHPTNNPVPPVDPARWLWSCFGYSCAPATCCCSAQNHEISPGKTGLLRCC